MSYAELFGQLMRQATSKATVVMARDGAQRQAGAAGMAQGVSQNGQYRDGEWQTGFRFGRTPGFGQPFRS